MSATLPLLAFADDRSPGADLAWLWLNEHTWPQWRLEVLTALHPPTARPLPASRTKLHEWCPPDRREPFAEANFLNVQHLVCENDPRYALLRPADLLVVGTRPGPTKGWHLGSTSDWLSQRPPAPMMIVRHGRPTRRVVICDDGSPAAFSATTTLCQLPWVSSTSIVVATVDDGRVDVDTTLRRASDRLSEAGLMPTLTVLEGEPSNELSQFTADTAADLVVLGTRGLTGLDRLRAYQQLRRGSTANALVHDVSANVLLACAARTTATTLPAMTQSAPTEGPLSLMTFGPGA